MFYIHIYTYLKNQIILYIIIKHFIHVYHVFINYFIYINYIFNFYFILNSYYYMKILIH